MRVYERTRVIYTGWMLVIVSLDDCIVQGVATLATISTTDRCSTGSTRTILALELYKSRLTVHQPDLRLRAHHEGVSTIVQSKNRAE